MMVPLKNQLLPECQQKMLSKIQPLSEKKPFSNCWIANQFRIASCGDLHLLDRLDVPTRATKHLQCWVWKIRWQSDISTWRLNCLASYTNTALCPLEWLQNEKASPSHPIMSLRSYTLSHAASRCSWIYILPLCSSRQCISLTREKYLNHGCWENLQSRYIVRCLKLFPGSDLVLPRCKIVSSSSW